MACDRKDDCSGCTCFRTAPCSHCTEDHINIDNHPECSRCGEILYEDSDIELLRHEVECFELE